MHHHLATRDLMTKHVVSLNPEMNLEEAWTLFSKFKISGAPVVAQDGSLVGILSQTDLAREAFMRHFKGFKEDLEHRMDSYFMSLEDSQLPDFFKKVKIEDVMDQDVLTASVSESVAVVAQKMRQNHVHRIVILDQGKVVGIVSALDLLSLIN